MDFLQRKSKILVTCALHVPGLLSGEMERFGKKAEKTLKNGVETTGTLDDCIRLNLGLRTAWRVLFQVDTFVCRDVKDLHRQLKQRVAWNDIIDRKGYFSVASSADHPAVKNAMFLNQLCKDAVADFFSDRYGIRPDSGKEKDRTVLFIHWKDDRVQVYVDTSGESLDKRGYRTDPFAAPVQETLAAACLAAMGWKGDVPFVNPMCGSGTFAIEAAMAAMDMAPGLNRDNFGFMHVIGYDEARFESIREELRGRVRSGPGQPILATDNQAMALKAARQNAWRAGVAEHIEFVECDFSDTPVPEGPGLVLLNPPYGERLGEAEALAPMYVAIGDFLKNRCAGKAAFVLSGNPDLAKKIRLQPRRRIPFLNGKIDCRLLEYEMYAGSRRQDRVAGGQQQ